MLALYYDALNKMVGQWGNDQYNYCYLIPFVILYLFWEKRSLLASVPSIPSWNGIAPVAFGLALFWLGQIGGEQLSLLISLWLFLLGVIWIHLGWKKVKIIIFALIFILTMFPLPFFLNANISMKLRLISSQLGVSIIQLYGLPAYREGNIIDLGFTQLQIVEACSGLNSLISLMVLCLLLAYFFKASFWKRAVLFVSSVPLAIFLNSMRIALTGILYEFWGPKVAEGFFHGFSGLLIFILSLPVLLFEMWILKKLPDSDRTSSSKDLESSSSASEGNPVQKKAKVAGSEVIFHPAIIITVILLAATLALSRFVDFSEEIPIKRTFDQFPLQINEWRGTRQIMEQKFLKRVKPSDYIIIDYKNRLGKEVNFYTVYHGSQRKGEAIHSPESCFPGAGWVLEGAGITAVSIPGYDKEDFRVNRVLMLKNGSRQLSYYWFFKQGRILTNFYQVKIFTLWDAITKKRTDGTLVRLITPIYGSEKAEDAEARLREITNMIVPLLEEFIPK